MCYSFISLNYYLNMTKVSIIIPTLNEEESLNILLNELTKYKEDLEEIIVVDANSDDNTLEVAKNFNCKIIIQEKKLGYGDAIIKGINASKCNYSLVLDGDGSKNPFYIKDLLDKIVKSKSDFVFAERYGKNAGSMDDTLLTYIGNRIFTYLGKIFFKIKINDILHTFFICKNSSFKKIEFNHLDFGFCVELPIKTERLKFNYKSLPTLERERLAGKVKVRSFVDGYKILKSMILIFFTSKRKNF